MDDGAVRFGQESPSHRTANPVVSIVVAALAIAVIALVGTGRPEPVEEVAPIVPPVDEPDAAAMSVLRDFEAALAAADIDGAVEVFDPDFSTFSLPGLVARPPAGDTSALRESLGFFNAVTDLSLGDCHSLDPLVPGHFRFRCTDVSLSPAYVAATTDSFGGHPWVSFIVSDGLIRAATDGYGENHRDGYEHYCIWSETNRGDLAMGLFDARCRPVETAANGPIHAELSQDFYASGQPRPTEEQLAARQWIILVDEFVELHNQGLGRLASERVATDLDPGPVPGFLASTETARPQPESLFAWTAVLYDIELGPCRVALDTGSARYSCPHAIWTGAFLDALGTGPIRQDLEFTLADRQITAIEGATNPQLAMDFVRFCNWAHDRYPYISNRAMTADCEPVHTGIGAKRLNVLGGWYQAAASE